MSKIKKGDKIRYQNEFFKIAAVTKEHIFLMPLERVDDKIIFKNRADIEKEIFKAGAGGC